jgi:hypothetical protein
MCALRDPAPDLENGRQERPERYGAAQSAHGPLVTYLPLG